MSSSSDLTPGTHSLGHDTLPTIAIISKKFFLTTTISYTLESLRSTINTYGARVKAAGSTSIDTKALGHAIRITEQILELVTTGSLVFPRPNSTYLRDVRMGNINTDEAIEYLNELFSQVDDLVNKSTLQVITHDLKSQFDQWQIEKLSLYYGL